MSNWILVNPPVWSLEAPSLSLEILAEAIQDLGNTCRISDINVSLFDHILSSEFVEFVSETLEREEATPDALVSAKLHEMLSDEILGMTRNVNRGKTDLRVTLKSERSLAAWLEGVVSHVFAPVQISPTGISGLESTGSSRFRSWFRAWFADIAVRWDFAAATAVGFTTNTDTQYWFACEMVEILRGIGHNQKYVVGGSHVTMMQHDTHFTDTCLSVFDFIGVYEGEAAIESIVRLVEDDATLTDSVNTITRVDGAISRSPLGDGTIALQSSPRFELSDLKSYHGIDQTIPIRASVSCYGTCTFCSGKRDSSLAPWTERTPEAVFDDMKRYNKNLGCTRFYFAQLCASPDFLAELASLIRRSRTPLAWIAPTRVSERFTQDEVEGLIAGGCKKLQIGIESGSDRILGLMKKRTSRSVIDLNLRSFGSAGLPIDAYFIRNFPSETVVEFRETLDLIRSNADVMDVFSLLDFVVSRNSDFLARQRIQTPASLEPSGDPLYPYTLVEDPPTIEWRRQKDELQKDFCVLVSPSHYRDRDNFVRRGISPSTFFRLYDFTLVADGSRRICHCPDAVVDDLRIEHVARANTYLIRNMNSGKIFRVSSASRLMKTLHDTSSGRIQVSQLERDTKSRIELLARQFS